VPFIVDTIPEESSLDAVSAVVKISNIDRQMDAHLRDYDEWLKTVRIEPITVDLYVVNTMTTDQYEVKYSFTALDYDTDAFWATFRLGTKNAVTFSVPKHTYLKNSCRWVFGDSRCGYTGTETECNKTLADCEDRGNEDRFGGFPLID
jgi:phage-related protein